MKNLQNCKFQKVLAPISVAGGATATCTEVDTKGFRGGAFIVQSGLIGANGVSLKWQESDTSGSGGADITGATHTALVDADDGINLVTFMDFRGRKRYITLVAVVGSTNACLLSALAILDRAEETPDNVTERGVQEQLFV
jgi:hypothetical protein